MFRSVGTSARSSDFWGVGGCESEPRWFGWVWEPYGGGEDAEFVDGGGS